MDTPTDATGREGAAGEPQDRRRIEFHYIKNAAFRVAHADGVVGSLTPRLQVHMNFWSERFPIPQRVVHEVGEDGRVGQELIQEREARDGVVREVEVGVVMDLETAKAFRDWLGKRIAEAETYLKKDEKGESKQ